MVGVNTPFDFRLLRKAPQAGVHFKQPQRFLPPYPVGLRMLQFIFSSFPPVCDSMVIL